MTDTEVTEGPGFEMLIMVIVLLLGSCVFFARHIMKADKRSFILSVITKVNIAYNFSHIFVKYNNFS